jgi:hypothetical protein
MVSLAIEGKLPTRSGVSLPVMARRTDNPVDMWYEVSREIQRSKAAVKQPPPRKEEVFMQVLTLF